MDFLAIESVLCEIPFRLLSFLGFAQGRLSGLLEKTRALRDDAVIVFRKFPLKPKPGLRGPSRPPSVADAVRV